jgi:hypothetical protein
MKAGGAMQPEAPLLNSHEKKLVYPPSSVIISGVAWRGCREGRFQGCAVGEATGIEHEQCRNGTVGEKQAAQICAKREYKEE